jgi:hypothetical protein
MAELDQWLTSLGLTNRNDRIRLAIRTASRPPASTNWQDATHHMFSVLEVLEFFEIFYAFQGDTSEELRSKLQKALDGPAVVPTELNTNSAGRNTTFELVIAAGLKRRELPVNLREADVSTTLNGSMYRFECKRPFSRHSVRANVKDAASQLNDIVGNGEFGVIAVSLSRIANPGNNYLQIYRHSENKLGAALGYVSMAAHDLACECMGDIARLSLGAKVIALMFHLATPVTTRDRDFWEFVSTTNLYPADAPVQFRKFGQYRTTLPAGFKELDDLMKGASNEWVPADDWNEYRSIVDGALREAPDKHIVSPKADPLIIQVPSANLWKL